MPPPETLEPLARVFNVSVSEIYQQAGVIDIPGIENLNPIARRVLEAVLPLPDEQKIAIIEFIERMYPRSGQHEKAEKTQDESVVRR